MVAARSWESHYKGLLNVVLRWLRCFLFFQYEIAVVNNTVLNIAKWLEKRTLTLLNPKFLGEFRV